MWYQRNLFIKISKRILFRRFKASLRYLHHAQSSRNKNPASDKRDAIASYIVHLPQFARFIGMRLISLYHGRLGATLAAFFHHLL